jgi:hypothetical protein
VHISDELMVFFRRILQIFENHLHLLSGKISDKDRRRILDALGQAGSDYRVQVYHRAFSGNKGTLATHDLKRFCEIGLQYIDHSIAANKRPDNLFHAYNLMTVENAEEISISYLSEMLEGQVAVLSSGYLPAQEVLSLLDALRNSPLYREDQHSYLLYPNKELPHFLDKNNLPEAAVPQSALLSQLVRDGNTDIIEKDVNGVFHFNGNFKNAADLQAALNELAGTEYAPLVEKDAAKTLQIFEELFNHKAFTGRSGTFFGYEGLGSIYWHMVSKLQLAVCECCISAADSAVSHEITGQLLAHYYEINEGIGVHKSPSVYGAFPTDPYSHTPSGKGAQQPGMTGQVKEDILSRWGELGVFVNNGQLYFNPCLLRKSEFLQECAVFEYVDITGAHNTLPLEKGSLCFTYCQIPIVYYLAMENSLTIRHKNGNSKKLDTLWLDPQDSREIFGRTGNIERIEVRIRETMLA